MHMKDVDMDRIHQHISHILCLEISLESLIHKYAYAQHTCTLKVPAMFFASPISLE